MPAPRLRYTLLAALASAGAIHCSSSGNPPDGGDAITPSDALDGGAPLDGADGAAPLDVADGATPADVASDVAADSTPADGATQPALPYQSGTRLRARVLDGAGGALLFQGWYDTQLTTNCSFAHTTDGQWHCVPDDVDQPVFLDANCTTPGALHYTPDPSCTPAEPRYAMNRPSRRCAPFDVGPIYRVGAAVTSTTMYYTRDANGCQPANATQYLTLYNATPVADATFVSGTVANRTVAGTVGAAEITAADGAHQVITARDVARDADCRALENYVGGDDLRCVPDWAQVVPAYSDATCSTHVAIDNGGCSPTVAIQVVPASCGATRLAYAIAGSVDTLYNNIGGTCTGTTAPATNSYWSLGAQLADGSLPELSFVDVGTGRLQARYLGAGGTALLRSNHHDFFDTNTNAPCTPQPVHGTLRCLPADVPPDSGGYYSDPACTASIAVVPVGAPGCPLPTATRVLRLTYDACGNLSGEVRELGAVVTGTVYYHGGADGACVADGPEPNFAFVQLGAVADETVYPAVTARTE